MVQSPTTTNPQSQWCWWHKTQGRATFIQWCWQWQWQWQNTSLATFIQWCWWCRGCELLQGHSDIKVTGAAGINHIGKVYCGNFDCKTESKADEWNQTPRYSWFLLCYCSVFKSNCWNFWYLLLFKVVCLFVFSIIQIKHSYLYSADD